MKHYEVQTLPDGTKQLLTSLRGHEVLEHSVLNKGSAFTIEERDSLGLHGLVPPAIIELDIHVARVKESLELIPDPLTQYMALLQLSSTNQTVFFSTLASDLDRYMPIVYTPTVGEACEKFSHTIRRAGGMYVPITFKDRIHEILRNWGGDDIRFAVVTDGSRILGLGDLGANGMGIPVGKLALYTAVAGVPPSMTIPITLDVGTDNPDLLNDPFYPGLHQPRATGEEYDDFIEAFVTAYADVFPNACIQWEDFKITHAESILAKYADRICSFNDDIQGTAAVAVAGLYAACRAKNERMSDQRVLFFGAGSAGIGIADLFINAVEAEGTSSTQARDSVRLFDKDGLLVSSRTDLEPFQNPLTVDELPNADFISVINEFKPTAIIGVSTVGGAFNADVLAAMNAINERPIIFPYSNPTSHSETTADAAYTAIGGKLLFASGSPFPPVLVDGRKINPSQGNNVYIFPALGLAILATSAHRVTEQMFLVAAQALAKQVTAAELANGLLYPTRDRIAESATAVASAVAEFIFDAGLAGVDRPTDIESFVAAQRYVPEYLPVQGQRQSRGVTT